MNPYLIFNGEAATVIEFYKKALGAKVDFQQTYGDSSIPCQDDWKQKIIHSRVLIQDNIVMIADAMPDNRVTMGDNIQLALKFEADNGIDSMFKLLSQDGTVKMPLQKTFWAEKFGMLTDKFGIHWMFNHESSKKS